MRERMEKRERMENKMQHAYRARREADNRLRVLRRKMRKRGWEPPADMTKRRYRPRTDGSAVPEPDGFMEYPYGAIGGEHL